MSITTLVPSVVARARSLGVKLKLSSLRDAISYALLDMPYSQAVFSERSGRAIDVVLPPPHFREAAERFNLDPLQLLLAFVGPAKPSQSVRPVIAAYHPARKPISYKLDNLMSANPAPLYSVIGTQEPQEAFVKMNVSGGVWAERSDLNGQATPESTYEQCTLQFSVPPAVDGRSLAEFLQGENGYSLLSCIHNGHTVESDGINIVSRLTPAAEQAVKHLEESLQNAPLIEVDVELNVQ